MTKKILPQGKAGHGPSAVGAEKNPEENRHSRKAMSGNYPGEGPQGQEPTATVH